MRKKNLFKTNNNQRVSNYFDGMVFLDSSCPYVIKRKCAYSPTNFDQVSLQVYSFRINRISRSPEQQSYYKASGPSEVVSRLQQRTAAIMGFAAQDVLT